MGTFVRRSTSFLLLVFFVWWWTGPSRDETTIYPANCTSFTPILPPLHSLDSSEFENSYAQYRKTRAECSLSVGEPTTYKLNLARGEVYYDGLGMPRRLVDCAILDNENWRCAYSDGSGNVTVRNGLRATERGYPGFSFSVHRYQWWYVTIYWLIFSEPPRGEWLIPEQEVAY